MKSPRQTNLRASPAASVQKSSRSWLLFVHQLPANRSNLRVQTWRRLQQFGAVAVKQAVYVLPDTPGTREDFEWLTAEVKAAGGDADVFIGRPANKWSDEALVEGFRRLRQHEYAALAQDVEAALKRIDGKKRGPRSRAPSPTRLLQGFQQRLTAIERIDYFGSAGRDRAAQLIGQLEARASANVERRVHGPDAESMDVEDYRGRLWVTRPRPGVDRMASAWLIRRFIDSGARFTFVADAQSLPPTAVPFDMFGVQFSHHGEHCTFETLCAVFGIDEAPVRRIATIVHDLDLKDDRFGASETLTVATVIDGLQLATADDDRLLADGMMLFESLYRSFEQSSRLAGPRPVVSAPRRAARKKTP